MDDFGIDSHKLHFHARRVADWQEGRDIFPIYVEVSPSGACNHRCTFCGLDFMGYKPRFLKTELACARLNEMGALGVKSVMFAGEGEPFLHRDMVTIALAAKTAGIDIAFTTNGVLLSPESSERLLEATSWIKVSCNAATPATYAAIHGTQAGDFPRMLDNLDAAVAVRVRTGAGCTLGAQMLLLPENVAEVRELARLCRDIGLDYLVIKPYSQHPQSLTTRYEHIDYAAMLEAAQEAAALSTETFRVIVRGNALRRSLDADKPYDRCLALPFWSYIDAGGGVWGCSVYLGDERFAYGNIADETFEAIWHGPRRAQSMDWVCRELDPSHCRVNCRMDVINRYLWSLTHPGPHVNFI